MERIPDPSERTVQDIMETTAATVTTAPDATITDGASQAQPQPKRDVTSLFPEDPGPVRPQRGGARHEPYLPPRASSQAPRGTVPAAVGAIEHSMSTPDSLSRAGV